MFGTGVRGDGTISLASSKVEPEESTNLDVSIAHVLEGYSDEEDDNIELVSQHSSDSDDSEYFLNHCSRKEVKLDTLDHSTADPIALPTHFLLMQLDCSDQDDANTKGDDDLDHACIVTDHSVRKKNSSSTKVVNMKKQGWHPLFRVDSHPKLCVGMPSEGPIPK